MTPAALAQTRPQADRFTVYGYGTHGTGSLLAACSDVSDGNKRKLSYAGTFGLSFTQHTCEGDSGGPHFVAGTNVIAGITSGGIFGVDANATTFSYPAALAAQIAAFER